MSENRDRAPQAASRAISACFLYGLVANKSSVEKLRAPRLEDRNTDRLPIRYSGVIPNHLELEIDLVQEQRCSGVLTHVRDGLEPFRPDLRACYDDGSN